MTSERFRENFTRQMRGRAFTLVEVLVALSLTVVLASLIIGAIRTIGRLTTAGRAQVEESQVVRSIVRQMETEIASIVYTPPNPNAQTNAGNSSSGSGTSSADGQSASGSSGIGSGGTATSGSNGATSGGSSSGSGGSSSGSGGAKSGGSSSGSSSAGGSSKQPGTGQSGSTGQGASSGSTSTTDDSTTTTTAPRSPEDAMGAASVGLVGSSNMLLLHISRPVRPGRSSSSTASDLRSVSYFLAQSGAGGLAGAVGERDSADGSDRKSRGGFARLEGERQAIDSADASSGSESLADDAKILAHEIRGVQFRYFDGQNWQESWDSQAVGNLPHAVEMVLQWEGPAATTETPTAAPTLRSRRYVFAPPQHLATAIGEQ